MDMRNTNIYGRAKYVLLTVAAVAFMFFYFGIMCYAAEGKITATAAKIRKEASTSSEQVGSAAQGATLTVTSQTTGADGKTWYLVTGFSGDTKGYVRSDLITVTGDVATTTPVTGTGNSGNNSGATISPSVPVEDVVPVTGKVAGEVVRVRADASTDGDVITTVQKNVELTIDGMATGTDNKTWFRISFVSGSNQVVGFIREDYITTEDEVITVAEQQAMEQAAQEEANRVQQEQQQAQEESKKYTTEEDSEVWYLVDNEQQVRYNIATIFEAAEKNAQAYQDAKKKMGTQTVFIVILVILVAALAGFVALLLLRFKDMADEALFKQAEKNVRPRSSAPRKVMHDVGNGQKRPAGERPARPAGERPVRPAGERPVRPAGERPARPAGERPARPAGERPARPAGERPVRPAGERPARPAGEKPVRPAGERPARPAGERPTGQQAKKPDGAWQSKNFMSDDDEFEFEFLNWDGDEEE